MESEELHSLSLLKCRRSAYFSKVGSCNFNVKVLSLTRKSLILSLSQRESFSAKFNSFSLSKRASISRLLLENNREDLLETSLYVRSSSKISFFLGEEVKEEVFFKGNFLLPLKFHA